MDAEIQYFAYGLELKFEADVLRPYEALAQPVFLPDQIACFRTSGAGAPSMLGLRKYLGQCLSGLLYSLPSEAWQELRARRSSQGIWEERSAVVLTEKGDVIPVAFFSIADNHKATFATPESGYIDELQKVRCAHGLGVSWISPASEGKDYPSEIPGLFVYGTLMRGECRYTILSDGDAVSSIQLGSVAGRLWDLGSYPGMMRANKQEERVLGEYVELCGLEARLPILDEVEDFRGWELEGSMYHRVLIAVDLGAGIQRLAWTYRLAEKPAGAKYIDSGDWRSSRGRSASFLAKLIATHCGSLTEREVALKLLPEYSHAQGLDENEALAELLPLSSALVGGRISERMLAGKQQRF